MEIYPAMKIMSENDPRKGLTEQSGWALIEYLVVAGVLVITFVLMRQPIQARAERAVEQIQDQLHHPAGTADGILNY